MQNCANCGHQNRPGVVYCENCGASLLGDKPLSTKSITGSEEEQAKMGIDSSVLTDVKVQGVSAFTFGDTLRLDIEGSPEPIIFKPKPETIFGRRDPATGAMPDVDLTPFAGYRMGVSRRHAAIRQGEEQSLNIWDLGSSNGTFLNGQKLSAHRPYRLHDGDELRLGQMMVRIHFQPGLEVVAAARPADTSAVQQQESKSEAAQLAADAQQPTTSDISEAGAEVATKTEAEAPAEKPAAPELKPEPEAKAEPEAKTEQPVSAPAQPAATAKSADKTDAKPEAAKAEATEKPAETGQEKPDESSVQDESAVPATGVQTLKTTGDAVQAAAKPPVAKPAESKPQPPDQKPEPPITDDFKVKKTPDDAPEKTDEASKPQPETADKTGEKPGEKPDKASDEKPDRPEQTDSQPESNEKKRD